MKKIFSFLCLIVAVTAMTSCSSAKEEKGITELEEQIKDMFFGGEISFNDEVYITNARH